MTEVLVISRRISLFGFEITYVSSYEFDYGIKVFFGE